MPNTLLHAQLEPITPILIKYIIKCIQLVQLIKHISWYFTSAISVWALPYLQLSPLDFLSRLHTGRYWPLTFFRGSLDYLRQDKMEPILVFLVAFLLFILLITFTISSTSSHLNHQRKGRIFTPLHQNNLHPSSDTYRDKHLHE